jgi:FtsH-binding integral membrane protein
MIPFSVNTLICLCAFLTIMYVFYRASPQNSIINPYFYIAVGSILMATVNIFMQNRAYSFWLFLLALLWFGLALFQLRAFLRTPR